MSGAAISVIVAVAIVVVVLVYVTIWMRRGGYSGMGGDTIVRCRSGHIFTTIWVPGVSFKAVRLGTSRFQYCPVGRHWSVVVPVKDADLTDEERLEAATHHDARIP
ncbi:MAG TPA: hypothetical protein VLX31_02455 [Streptosporangiaceae bacterium]|nr:hypothetical protein [Streptosporangiaceae bacterium]